MVTLTHRANIRAAKKNARESGLDSDHFEPESNGGSRQHEGTPRHDHGRFLGRRSTPMPLFERQVRSPPRKRSGIAKVAPAIYRPSQSFRKDTEILIDSSPRDSDRDSDRQKKDAKQWKRSPNSGRESGHRNASNEDRVQELKVELMEQQVKLLHRINRDYQKIVDGLTKGDSNQWLISSMAGQLGGIRNLLETSTLVTRE